LKAQLTLSNH